MFWIWNDLFRIRIQVRILSSGSNPKYLSIFGNYKKNTAYIQSKRRMFQLSAIFNVIILNSPTVHSPSFTDLNFFYLSPLSFFAGSGTIIPDPDPQHIHMCVHKCDHMLELFSRDECAARLGKCYIFHGKVKSQQKILAHAG